MIYFIFEVVRDQQRIIHLLKEQMDIVCEPHAPPWPVPAAPGLLGLGSRPGSAATSASQEHVPWLLTAMPLLVQEGKDKHFLIEKLHSIYEQRERLAPVAGKAS